jgi:structure-specific recognition protein 1
VLYQNAMRGQFKRDNPGMTFGQLSKYTSHMYKNLSKRERTAWDQRSAEDKARYNAELANYQAPPGHDARGFRTVSEQPRLHYQMPVAVAAAPGAKRRSKKVPRDPNMPKRASGAYVFFTNFMRPKLNREFPGIKFVDLGKMLGQRWRALTPKQKKKYEDMAAEDKVRFQVEMARYQAEQQEQQQQQQEGGSESSEQEQEEEEEEQAPQQQEQYYDPTVGHHGYYQDPYAHHAQY